MIKRTKNDSLGLGLKKIGSTFLKEQEKQIFR